MTRARATAARNAAASPPVRVHSHPRLTECGTDLRLRAGLADTYTGLGEFHPLRAATSRTPIAGRIEGWREARRWHGKSLEIWNDWSRRAPSTTFDATRRERAARAAAECDSLLVRLGVASKS